MLLAAVLAGFLWEIADERDGRPSTQLGAVAGTSFVVGTIWYPDP